VQSPEWRTFADELARQGFVEGRNLDFVHRYAGTYVEPEATNRMREQARELVRFGVDLIYAVDDGSSAISAQQVTHTVPIVFDRSWRDPVALGLVASLARPGGNTTGNAVLGLQIEAKAFEVLINALGPLKAIAILRTSMLASWPGFEKVLAQRRALARELGVELVQFEVDTVDALPAVLQRIRAVGIRAVKFDDPEGFDTRRREVLQHFERQGLAGLSTEVDYARQGLLFGFGWDVADIARRSARYVASILEGANPGDLPVEQVDKVYLVVNRRAAEKLGIRLPPAVLLRADEVIE
jgi:putative ABC transport system substrate-binding protein